MSGIRVAIVGAGGHAVVVADALLSAGLQIDCFLETDDAKVGTMLRGLPVVHQNRLSTLGSAAERRLANGIGGGRNTRARRAVQEGLEGEGWPFLTVRHPTAIISADAHIDEGAHLLAGSIVQSGAHIGRGAILNTGSIVEHDCRIGAWTHIAPGAVVCGDVVVGEGSLIGAGSVIIQGLAIGGNSLIGAGAAVVRNFEGNGTLCGVPARPVGNRSE